jgi:hypothetical protein
MEYGVVFLQTIQKKGVAMFQVVIQSALRQMKSRLRLPAPPQAGEGAPDSSKPKDKSSLILILFLMGTILLLAVFSNLA